MSENENENKSTEEEQAATQAAQLARATEAINQCPEEQPEITPSDNEPFKAE